MWVWIPGFDSANVVILSFTLCYTRGFMVLRRRYQNSQTRLRSIEPAEKGRGGGVLQSGRRSGHSEAFLVYIVQHIFVQYRTWP